MGNQISIDECRHVLEAAIGEIGLSALIPDEVLEATLSYLDEYEKLKFEKSWDDFPERMGR